MKSLPNLLIVDDTEENLVLLESLIYKIEVNLIRALSGSEALEKTRGIELALAIIDVWMPGMNGYELALKMNEERSGMRVPIIFITANYSNDMEVFKGYDSGAIDYITKPINNHILLYKINVFLDLFNQKQTIIRDVALLKKSADELSRINTALTKSEENYRSYIDNAPDGVFVVNETGTYIEVNEAASRITGYSKDELLKMSISDIHSEESLKDGYAYFRKLVQTGISKADLSFKHKNGTTRWWSVEAVKLSKKRFLGFTKDITDFKLEEIKRKESEKRLKEAQVLGRIGNWEFDLESQKIMWSDQTYKLYDRNPILGPPTIEEESAYYSPEQGKALRKIAQRAIEEVKDFEYDVKINLPGGRKAYFQTKMQPVMNANGKVIKLFGTIQDITVRKQAEEELIRNFQQQILLTGISYLFTKLGKFDVNMNEALRLIGEYTKVSRVYVFEDFNNGEFTNNTYEWCNTNIEPQIDNLQEFPYKIVPSWKKFLIEKGMVLSSNVLELPQDLIEILEPQKIISIFVLPIYVKDQFFGFIGFDDCEKHRIWIKSEIELLKTVTNVISTLFERKQSENELRREKRFTENIITTIPDSLLVLDKNLKIKSANRTFYETFKMEPKKVIGTPITNILGSEDGRLSTALTKLFGTDDMLENFELHYRSKKMGSPREVRKLISKGERIFNIMARGIIVAEEEEEEEEEEELIVLQDITESKQAENAMKVSEEKYRTMLNASPDGIILLNLKGFITEVSAIGLELLGVDNRDKLIAQHFLRFVLSEEKNIFRGVIEKTMNEGIAQNIEIKIRKKDQSLFLSEISSTLLQDPKGMPFSFMVTIRDISQRKKMEKKQIHADRMANLGEMASGIAHEINQPLNTISLIMDNVLYEFNKDEDIKKDYLKKKSDKIFENITRIRNIIDHIKAFSRSHDDYLLTAFDINSSIQNAVTMISEQFKHLAINLNLQLDKNTPLIIGNSIKFEQVILNLLSNSKDAIIEKKSKQPADFDMFVGIRSFLKDQRLIIEIADNGTGITEEDIEHIMLPFYTTKDTGKGTGLGLSISYQIIKEMNGTIEIKSNKFEGTTFKIVLKVPNKE